MKVKLEDPELVKVLRVALEFEEENLPRKCSKCSRPKPKDVDEYRWECICGKENIYLGFEWFEVAQNAILVRRLLNAGLLKVNYKSNKHTHYVLSNREEAREILEDRDNKEKDNNNIAIDELFNNIIGYDAAKNLLRRVLKADKPIHVLLVGPPASAKTEFLLEIEKLDGAYLTIGPQVSKAGLTNLLFQHDIRYLIIDEIEDLNDENIAILLFLMQNQMVVETKYGRTREKESKTWVFGTCNDTKRLREALLSRFFVLRFKPYTRDCLLYTSDAADEN